MIHEYICLDDYKSTDYKSHMSFINIQLITEVCDMKKQMILSVSVFARWDLCSALDFTKICDGLQDAYIKIGSF